jgi:hypothetical protein
VSARHVAQEEWYGDNAILLSVIVLAWLFVVRGSIFFALIGYGQERAPLDLEPSDDRGAQRAVE